MSVRLISRNRIPYGAVFKYKHPVTGIILTGSNWDMLCNVVRDYNKANDYPVGLEFEKEIEQNVCQQHPSECEFDSPLHPKPVKLTIADVVRGAAVMTSHVLNGSQLVSQSEANRRAEICSNCIHNTYFPKACSGLCGELKDIASKFTPNKITPFDEDGRVCGICRCFTRVHVWFPYETLEKGLTEEMKQSFSTVGACWKKPE